MPGTQIGPGGNRTGDVEAAGFVCGIESQVSTEINTINKGDYTVYLCRCNEARLEAQGYIIAGYSNYCRSLL